MTTSESTGSPLLRRLLITIALLGGVGAIAAYNYEAKPAGPVRQALATVQGKPADPVSLQQEERRKIYQAAVTQGQSQAASWPGTPQDLITQFWLAASKRDYARMMVLCPGSKDTDYKRYYDTWTPSPASAIGPPEPHPRDRNIQLYPAHVAFPGFPQKVVKLAVTKTPDGRLVIDGAHSIWW